MLKETTEAFDGAPHYESDMQSNAPRRPLEIGALRYSNARNIVL